ncbi:chaplin family protein [Streptomyces marincola]|uniref:chaplin family protein n=1 Tax=Streptomyces marincola TaxID=2878388 RepID=UPI001CF218C1|nr:chaplin family protein [Streptomyces marincola]UCM87160.1 chaplin [Streptomyces marincola]
MNTAKRAALVLVTAGTVAGTAAGTAAAAADAGAQAVASPGVASGNIVQIPVNLPVTVVGNSVNVVGLLNPTWGNVGVVG